MDAGGDAPKNVLLLCERLKGRPGDFQRNAIADRATVNLFMNLTGVRQYLRWEQKNSTPIGAECIRDLNDTDSLYVIGHGETWALEGLTEVGLANGLVHVCGLRAVRRIYLVSCNIGGDDEMPHYQSFARLFHRLLGKNFGIRAEVIAWNDAVNVDDRGQVYALNPHGMQITYYWEGDEQRAR